MRERKSERQTVRKRGSAGEAVKKTETWREMERERNMSKYFLPTPVLAISCVSLPE